MHLKPANAKLISRCTRVVYCMEYTSNNQKPQVITTTTTVTTCKYLLVPDVPMDIDNSVAVSGVSAPVPLGSVASCAKVKFSVLKRMQA